MSSVNLNELNFKIETDPISFIHSSEELYREKIKTIKETLDKERAVRIVLLAGPSGSGKTTTANLISDAIKESGRESLVLSLDDFYRDSTDKDYPRLENGERDFESPYALDLKTLTETLKSIANGEEFYMPKYDFKIGKRSALKKHSSTKDGVVIIEGLHALNPLIFSLLPERRVFKIFISVSTNINNDGKRILSGRKIRFVRRLVRDSIYRNADANVTLSMWFSVLKGEDEYLYPNRIYADVSFDTFHEFELGIMRPFVEKLISPALAKENEYAAAVFSALTAVKELPIEYLPDNSLIREFVPGGIYEMIY